MELAPSVSQFLSWKKQKAERDAWQHFVLGCLNSAPPWEIPAGSDPAPPGHPKGSPGQPLGHKSLWDLLENRKKREGKPTQTAVMGDLSAQGWSWVGSGATSDIPVSIRQDTGPEGLEQDRQGQEGSQESPSHITAALVGMQGRQGLHGHSTTVLSSPGSFHGSSPKLALCPAPSLTLCQHPSPKGGSHSLGSPQRDPGAAQEPQEPGGSRAEQSSLTQAAERENPAPKSSWEPS